MFTIFTKKPFLKDLIPPGYVDIHSHLLPGIDDGAKTFEDTQILIRGLHDLGFSQLITTPHIMQHVWENSAVSIQSALAETNDLLHSAGQDISLRAAAEYMLDGNFTTLLASEKLLTMAEKYVLVEMSYLNPPIQLYDIIFEIQLAGYIPVLAHPERYSYYHTNFDEFTKLKNAGCRFQINLLSVVGYYGNKVTTCVSQLLQNGYVDFTGSDVHHKAHLSALNRRLLIKNHSPLTMAMKNNSVFTL